MPFYKNLWSPSAALSPPIVVWVTPAGPRLSPPLPLIGQPYSTELEVTLPLLNQPVTFSLQAGALPPMASFTNATATKVNITGVGAFAPDVAPIWVTASGSLGKFTENQNVGTITLSATAQAPATTINTYSVVSPSDVTSIPYGILLNPSTGKITGITENLVPGPIDVLSPPTWVTASGSLGVFRENQSVGTITLSATSPDTPITYQLVNMEGDKLGRFPSGIILTNTTGQITGVTDTTFEEGLKITIGAPTFTTPAGSIGTFSLGDTISFTFGAIPGTGSFSGFEIISAPEMNNQLPFGVKLNSSSGLLEGTIVAPTIAGTKQSFNVRVYNSIGSFVERDFFIEVAP